MISLQRVRGVLVYLGATDPIYRWRIVAAECPYCGPSHFLVMRPDPFLTRCLRCKANVTNLSIIQAIQQNLTGLQDKIAYEMSTYGSTYSFLKSKCSEFHCSEFFPGRKSGEWIEGIRNEDAQQLSFRDESIDIITSNQVFEHVPDDIAAYKECWRTLKTAGSLMFTVPLHNTTVTEKAATLRDGVIQWLSTPEYHSSRTTGPNSVPVFWRFSVNDIAERVGLAGFRNVSLIKVVACAQQVLPQIVIHAVK